MASVTGARQLSLPANGVTAATCDQQTWNALVECYSQQVWSRARARGLNPVEAAQLSQLVWLRLADHLAEVAAEGRIESWLCGIVDLEARVALNRRGWRQQGAARTATTPLTGPSAPVRA